jgi:HSP20 family molecular chaperone IbpA
MRIAVPRAPPQATEVPIATTPLPELPEPRATTTLALPGFGPSDLTATITKDRALTLTVSGKSDTYGRFTERLGLPERAVPDAAVAAMVNGVFSFSVPIAPETVAAVPVAAGPAEAPSEHQLLLEAACPGLGPGDITAEMRGRHLTIASTKPAITGAVLRRSGLLPPYTAAAELAITVAHGVLRVTAPRPMPPTRTRVEVSGLEAVTLPRLEKAAPAAEAAEDAPMTVADEQPAAEGAPMADDA